MSDLLSSIDIGEITTPLLSTPIITSPINTNDKLNILNIKPISLQPVVTLNDGNLILQNKPMSMWSTIFAYLISIANTTFDFVDVVDMFIKDDKAAITINSVRIVVMTIVSIIAITLLAKGFSNEVNLTYNIITKIITLLIVGSVFGVAVSKLRKEETKETNNIIITISSGIKMVVTLLFLLKNIYHKASGQTVGEVSMIFTLISSIVSIVLSTMNVIKWKKEKI